LWRGGVGQAGNYPLSLLLIFFKKSVPAIVMRQHIEGPLVGRYLNPVRFACIRDEARYFPVRIKTIHPLDRLVHRLPSEIAGIGEIDASILIDRKIVECIVRLAVVETSQNIALASLHVCLRESAAPEIGPLSNNKVALSIEFHPV